MVKRKTRRRRKYSKRHKKKGGRRRRRRKTTKKIRIAYNKKKWNKPFALRKSHNCYTYFLNKQQKAPTTNCKKELASGKKNCTKPQPGNFAGYKKIKDKKNYTCSNLVERILADNPNIYISDLNKDCGSDFYMGAVVVNPGQTYHFYRRDDNGKWSHKDGGRVISLVDASGVEILDPKISNRNYGPKRNYSDFCQYFCVPRENNKKNMKLKPRNNANK